MPGRPWQSLGNCLGYPASFSRVGGRGWRWIPVDVAGLDECHAPGRHQLSSPRGASGVLYAFWELLSAGSDQCSIFHFGCPSVTASGGLIGGFPGGRRTRALGVFLGRERRFEGFLLEFDGRNGDGNLCWGERLTTEVVSRTRRWFSSYQLRLICQRQRRVGIWDFCGLPRISGGVLTCVWSLPSWRIRKSSSASELMRGGNHLSDWLREPRHSSTAPNSAARRLFASPESQAAGKSRWLVWLMIGPKFLRFEQMFSDLVDTFLRRPPNNWEGCDDRPGDVSSVKSASLDVVWRSARSRLSRTDLEKVEGLCSSISRENRL